MLLYSTISLCSVSFVQLYFVLGKACIIKFDLSPGWLWYFGCSFHIAEDITLFWVSSLHGLMMQNIRKNIALVKIFFDFLICKLHENGIVSTVEKMKFSVEYFCGKCEQIRRKLQICSYFLKKSSTGSFIFCAAFHEWKKIIFATFTDKNMFETLKTFQFDRSRIT